MKWDILKFIDGIGRERRRLELSEIEGSDALGALLREIEFIVAGAEKGAPIPHWLIEKQPELEAEHSRRMRGAVQQLSQFWTPKE